MTSTASPDQVDPAAGRQGSRADELEHWLTDLRVNVSEDAQAWLRSSGDNDQPAGELPIAPPSAEDHSGQEPAAEASPTDRSSGLKGDPPRPVVGRHRAAD
jgi:hypothetical protein